MNDRRVGTKDVVHMIIRGEVKQPANRFYG